MARYPATVAGCLSGGGGTIDLPIPVARNPRTSDGWQRRQASSPANAPLAATSPKAIASRHRSTGMHSLSSGSRRGGASEQFRSIHVAAPRLEARTNSPPAKVVHRVEDGRIQPQGCERAIQQGIAPGGEKRNGK